MLRATISSMLFVLALLAPSAASACSCVGRTPHAFGENGRIPANAEGVFLNLPVRGDFRVEAELVRDGQTQACRSDLQNASLEDLRLLNLRCSLRGAQTLRVKISTHGETLHVSQFSVTDEAPVPTDWGSISVRDTANMKVRVAQTKTCQEVVGASGSTLRFSWSKAAAPWADVALVVPEVDGQAFASQSHHLCDGHLAHLSPAKVAHEHLFATELAMEQQKGATKKRTVSARVLLAGRAPVRLPELSVTLPARLSGKPVASNRAPSTRGADSAAIKRVSTIIDRCRGKEGGEVVAKIKVSGLTGQVLSTQVRAPTTKISACVRKRTQAQKFEARGGGKDYEFEISR